MEIDAEVTIAKRGGHGTSGPIEVKVHANGIGVHMGLVEFLTALAVEVGSPAFMFRQAALEKELQAAAGAVLARMRQETVKL